jgi:16S rRNA (guanine527-N7)-methyltransferase
VVEVVGGPPQECVDLGSGGGVPGLVLATSWPASRWTLIEAGRRRCAYLAEAIARLGLGGRVQVVGERAEAIGRDPGHRGRYGLVVARSFGPPPVTAECAAPLLRTGGFLVVSEPPDSDGARWEPSGLAVVGMEPVRLWQDMAGTFQVVAQRLPCPDRYPRRTGVPAKRPLF